jgi:uncharacterized protein (DUF302 family)
MSRRILRFATALTLLLGLTPTLGAESYAIYRSQSSFADVLQALKMAIEEKGLYINNIMHMGEMLERTGKDLGLGDSPYRQAESIEFCSAILSRKMTDENPARVVNCPFIVSVYVRTEEPDVTYIVHRRLDIGDDTPVMQEVEAMLETLGKAAAEAW